MIIQYVPNILEKKDREGFEVVWEPITVEQWCEQLNLTKEDLVPVVGGGVKEWDYVPAKQEELIFVQNIKGSNIGRLINAVVGVALIVISPLAGPLGPALYAAGWGMLISSAVGFVASLFLPSMSTPKIGKGDFDSSPTYSWNGIENGYGEGSIVPIVYGDHRTGGVAVEQYIEGETISGTQERKYLNLLYAVSEGEIYGVDHSSVKIENKELSYYGSSVSTWSTQGEKNQAPLTNFSKVWKHYSITGNVKITNSGGAFIYKTNNDVNSVVVTLQFGGLYLINSKSGSLESISASYRFEYSLNGTDWNTYADVPISGKTQAVLEHDTRMNFSTKDTYYIRIGRLTGDWDGDQYRVGESYLKSVSEIENSTLSYPSTALFGLSLKATDRLSGSVPAITWIAKGRKVKDVRNLSDPPSEANRKNPANHILDLFTSSLFGMGRNVEQIHQQSFIDFANWCDDMVSYEKWNSSLGIYQTHYQKRYEINLCLDVEFDAIDLIHKICTSCRAVPFWEGDKLKIVIDKPQTTYSQIFSMGNIITDSYEETYFGLPDAPTQIEVQYLDDELDFEKRNIVAVDTSRVGDDVVGKQIQLYGITNNVRAKREAIFAMKKAKGTTKIVKFSTTIQALFCEIGDLFYFQHDIPQYGYGGNILTISGSSVYLDRNIPEVAGKQYRLRVRKKNNTFVSHEYTAGITQVTNKIDNVSIDFEEGDVYCFGPINYEAKPFRCISIVDSGQGDFNITGEEYNPSIYEDDDSIHIRDLNYSLLGLTTSYNVDGATSSDPDSNSRLPTDPTQNPDFGAINDMPPLVTDVVVFEEQVLQGKTYVPSIVVNFTPVIMPDNSKARIVKYEIWYSTDEGVSWVNTGMANNFGYHRIRSVEVGTNYWIVVKPFTNYGVTNYIEYNVSLNSPWQVTPVGDVWCNPPTNLVVVGDMFQNLLTWVNPPDPDLEYVEIYASMVDSPSPTPGEYKRVGVNSGTIFYHAGLGYDQKVYYRIRAKDTNGNYSAWHPEIGVSGISGTTTTNPAKLLAQLTGAITQQELTPSLLEQLDSNEGMQLIETTLNNQKTIKITENDRVAGVGLIMYPSWDSSVTYSLGNNVLNSSDQLVYRSLVNNNTGNQPAYSPSQWAEIPYGASSEFAVVADRFQVVGSDSDEDFIVPFIVDTVTSTVGINGALVVHGSITGDKISSQSIVVLEDDGYGNYGKLVVGNDNIVLDSETNSITVAPDGGKQGQDYAELKNGDLKFYYYANEEHILYKSIKRMESGVCQSGVSTTLPGYWKAPPTIMVSPKSLQIYDGGASTQDQFFECSARDLAETAVGSCQYKFTPRIELQLSSGTVNISGNTHVQAITGAGWVHYSGALYIYPSKSGTRLPEEVENKIAETVYHDQINMPPYTRGVSFSAKHDSQLINNYQKHDTYSAIYRMQYEIHFQAYYSGAWHSYQSAITNSGDWTGTSLSTGADIAAVRIATTYVSRTQISNDPATFGDPLTIYHSRQTTIGNISCNLAGSATIASGYLNYIAIGE